jgi:DNA (cytosine-5)-methyltransferase 1
VPAGGYWRDLPDDLQREYMMKSYFLGGGKTGMARRLSWDEPSLTLTCAPAQKQTERCHPEETRPLTVREYARIPTFPDDWTFRGSTSSQYKQIGNAVPVNLAYAVGRSLIHLLNKIEEVKPLAQASSVTVIEQAGQSQFAMEDPGKYSEAANS